MNSQKCFSVDGCFVRCVYSSRLGTALTKRVRSGQNRTVVSDVGLLQRDINIIQAGALVSSGHPSFPISLHDKHSLCSTRGFSHLNSHQVLERKSTSQIFVEKVKRSVYGVILDKEAFKYFGV